MELELTTSLTPGATSACQPKRRRMAWVRPPTGAALLHMRRHFAVPAGRPRHFAVRGYMEAATRERRGRHGLGSHARPPARATRGRYPERLPRPHRRVGWHGQWQAPPAVAAPPAAWGVCRLTTLLCGRLPAGPHPMSAPGSSQRPHVHPPSPRSQGCQQDSILFNPLPCNYPTVARTNTSPPPHHSNPSPPLSQPPPD